MPVSDAGDAEPAISCWRRRRAGRRGSTARVTERLGDPFAPRSFSLIAIHKLGIPTHFRR
jgi:ribonuclease R